MKPYALFIPRERSFAAFISSVSGSAGRTILKFFVRLKDTGSVTGGSTFVEGAVVVEPVELDVDVVTLGDCAF